MVAVVVALLLFLAFLCFAAGAIGLQARVNWDQAGKACVTLAALVYAGPWVH